MVFSPDERIRTNDLVNRCTAEWVRLTGTDPAATQFVFGGNRDGWDSYRLNQFLKELNESRTLDPSGLTSYMLLRGGFREYTADRTVPLLSLITRPTTVAETVAPLAALHEILEEEEISGAVDLFTAKINEAAAHYELRGPGLAELPKLLADPMRMARVRRDAFRSIETLETLQFVHGEPDAADLKVNPTIYEFWTMNSLLTTARAAESGVTMALVRDPEVALFSFFCITVRNGATLTVLTDRSPTVHPAQRSMSRRPDRELERRASRHWFPYELLGIETSSDSKRLWAEQVTALVPEQAAAAPIGSLRDLGAEGFVWWCLLLELLWERYGVQNPQLPRAYTGSMVVQPEELVSRNSELVASGSYQPLELPPVTPETLESPASRAQWGTHTSDHNQWLVDRYGRDIAPEILNPVGTRMALEAGPAAREASSGYHLGRLWMSGDTLVGLEPPDPWRKDENEGEKGLVGLDPLTFNTPENIQRDREWVARMNQVKVIQGRALKEFEEARAEHEEWYRKAVERNLESILDRACAAQEGTRGDIRNEVVWGPTSWTGSSYSGISVPRTAAGEDSRRPGGVLSAHRGCVVVDGGWDPRARDRFCYERPGTRVSMWSEIRPRSADELVRLLNLGSVEELPWGLRHWRYERPSISNYILNRVDPAEWYLTDPWQQLRLRIYVCLCRWAAKARRKRMGLSEIKG